jgi:hypothetical protein
MAALVQGDEPAPGEMLCQSLPVTSVGAETVEQQTSWLAFGFGVRCPLEVMEAHTVALEPTINRRDHRR